MKRIFTLLFLFISLNPYAQSGSDSLTLQQIKATQNFISKIVGKKIFEKHFFLDSIDSRYYRSTVFAGNSDNGSAIIREENFNVVFNILKEKDTVGYLSITIDRNGKPLNDWREPAASGRPEIIVGFKKLLNNEFNIDYQKAISIARSAGFNTAPILNAETEYVYKESGRKTYILVKYFWTFFKRDDTTNSMLNINAETGVIEKEINSNGISYQ